MKRLIATLVFPVALAAGAQTHSGQVFRAETKGTRTEIVLRIQRMERTANSCAVVYPGDKVHYEVRAMNGTEVMEGPLPAESAAQLHAFIAGLQQIEPQAIQRKTRLNDVDQVLISVPAASGMKNRHFQDSDTRKPFKEQVEPAIKWLGSLHGQHLPKLANAQPNNCVPQDTFDPGSSNAPAAVSAAMAQNMEKRLLMRAHVFGLDEGMIRNRCILVTPTGDYRYETMWNDRDGRQESKVYTGTLDGDELADLKKVLDTPSIRDAQHTAGPPSGVEARDIETMRLTVPRGDHVQQLDVYSFTGVRAASANVKVTSDIDDRTVAPLRLFLRDSIEKRKGAQPNANAAPNDCARY